MFFGSKNAALNSQMDVIFALLDAILKEMTIRQSEILYYKLLGFNEEEIASKLSIKQSAVNQQSNSFSWPSIESAVNYFEKLNFEQ
jgi:DNA-binding NarL/FixJ family response regulator